MTNRTVGVNELGYRVGDSHHRAKLTDGDVELLLSLRVEGWGYGRLAAKFEVSKRTVRDIVHGRTRAQWVASWRKVRITG